MAFRGEGPWSFGNDFAGNVVLFSADNSSSSYTDNWKNNFLVLGEGSADDINDSTGVTKKNLVLTLVKQRQNFTSIR